MNTTRNKDRTMITSNHGTIGNNSFAISWRNNAKSFRVHIDEYSLWLNPRGIHWDLPSGKGSLEFDRIDIATDCVDLLITKEPDLLIKPFTLAESRPYGYEFRFQWLYTAIEWKIYL